MRLFFAVWFGITTVVVIVFGGVHTLFERNLLILVGVAAMGYFLTSWLDEKWGGQ